MIPAGVYTRAEWRQPTAVGRRKSTVEVLGGYKSRKIYKLRKARGIPTVVPAEGIANHITRLYDWHFSDYAIAAAAGVDQTTINGIRRGRRRSISIDYAQRIMAVTHRPVPAQARMRIPGIGTSRRIRALQANGWSTGELGRQLDVSDTNISQFASNTRVYFETWEAIAALYDRISGTPGPSEYCSKRARIAGHMPPLAWEGIDIDHPDSEPDIGEVDKDDVVVDEVLLHRILRGEHVGEVPTAERKAVLHHAIEHNWNKTRVAEALGIKPATADQALVRLRRERREREAA